MKTQGPKCFYCGERGHLASKCDKRAITASDINIVTRSAHKKYVKEVSINNQKIEVLIDTGSDICLMCAGNVRYIRLGTPKLKEKMIRFRSIGSGDNITLVRFDAIVNIDKNDYPIRVHVISDTLMKHELFIGADFPKSVHVTMTAGEIIINASESIPENKERYVN